ncbi:hypothetical protein HW555_011017 [Spodoptera exigua]|uniref:Transposase n=1 Tax=Spodoptera exigua TaxID=7107 RepID=A0A835G640_SPOEX|nr:hypothetical protein HW555_011017 [Spodoptera exigua]
MFRVLADGDIENCLEEIPSDDDSCCSAESDQETHDAQPPTMLLGDVVGERLQSYSFDEEDSEPLSSLRSTLPPQEVATPVAEESTSSSLQTRAPKWKKNYSLSPPGEFTEDVGVPAHILELESITPLALFRMFWSNDLQGIISFQTNLYATQSGKAFTPTTPEEIDVFVAVNLVMGIKKLPSYRDYWCSAPDLHDTYSSMFMPLKRFSWLLHYLHLNDNNVMPARNSPGYDKVYKIHPLLDIMRRNFQHNYRPSEKIAIDESMHNYRPSEKIAIDESMVKFKGRSYLKQYMPKKPIKRGYKIWMICAQSGYCLDFELYTGKQGSEVGKDLGGRVVRQFCSSLRGKNHKVYFDNVFNSYQLQIDLRDGQILACGTVNSNRKLLPKLKEDKDLQRGQHDYRISDTNVSILKWRDKRSVFILSNYHDPKNVGKVTRRERNGETVEISCPEAVIDYNSHMNFVDKFDQLKSCYDIDRKSHKWWHRIFFHFLDCSVVNSFLVYKELQSTSRPELETLTLKNFRRSVYQGLLAPAYVNQRRHHSVDSPRSSGAPSSGPAVIKRHKPTVADEIRLESNRHQPERSTSRRCAKCSTSNTPVRTVWKCKTCNVPLCLRKGKSCFEDFHKKEPRDSQSKTAKLLTPLTAVNPNSTDTGTTQEQNYRETTEVPYLVETDSQENLYLPIQGRRIVNMMYFIQQLQKISSHSSLFDCNLKDMTLIGESRNGLISKYKFKCIMCQKDFIVTNEELASEHNINANLAAATGITSAGIGFSQFKEITACMDLPIFTKSTYLKIQDNVYEKWEATAVESMEIAAIRERDAAIVGRRFGQVLFIGKRPEIVDSRHARGMPLREKESPKLDHQVENNPCRKRRLIFDGSPTLLSSSSDDEKENYLCLVPQTMPYICACVSTGARTFHRLSMTERDKRYLPGHARDDDTKATCLYCDVSVSRGSKAVSSKGFTTSNMWTHVKRYHEKELKNDTPSTSTTEAGPPLKKQATLEHVLNKNVMYDTDDPRAKAITQTIAEQICIDMEPFDIVNKQGFNAPLSSCERHSGENIAENLRQLFQDWGIDEQVRAVVTDNAPNMGLAVTQVGMERIRCMAHSLQLVLRDAMSSHAGILPFRHLGDFLNSCSSVAVQASLPHVKCKTELATEEWVLMEQVVSALTYFEEATKSVSQESACLSDAIPLINSLRRVLERIKNTTAMDDNAYSPEYNAFILNLIAGINDRFDYLETDETFILATALDPRYKLRTFTLQSTSVNASA